MLYTSWGSSTESQSPTVTFEPALSVEVAIPYLDRSSLSELGVNRSFDCPIF